MGSNRRTALALALAASAGCSESVQVIFVLEAGPGALDGATSLRVRGCVDRRSEDCFGQYDESRPVAELTFPQRVPIGPPGDARTAEYAVQAELLDASSRPLARVAAFGPYPDASGAEVVRRFAADCRGQLCPASETCLNTQCISACEANCGGPSRPDAGGPADAGELDSGPPGMDAEADLGPREVSVPDATTCACPCSSDRCVDGRCEPAVVVELVAAGSGHTCASPGGLGPLWCWGDNRSGQLGLGGAAGDLVTEPSTVALSGSKLGLSAGETSTCATLNSGQMWCFGSNDSNRLGREESGNSARPVLIGADLSVAWSQPSVRGRHACATTSTGRAFCWGRAKEGQVGAFDADAVPLVSRTPASVATFLAVAVGERHSCGLAVSRRLRCWGRNQRGQTGRDPTTDMVYRPENAGVGTYLDVAAAKSATCAVRTDGQLRCAGDNSSNRFGLAQGASSIVSAFVPVEGISDVRDIEMGADHQCALTSDDRLLCWGANPDGQLGVGDLLRRTAPTEVSSPQDAGWVQVSTGENHTCAIDGAGALFCWGQAGAGQLGPECGRRNRDLPCRVCLEP